MHPQSSNEWTGHAETSGDRKAESILRTPGPELPGPWDTTGADNTTVPLQSTEVQEKLLQLRQLSCCPWKCLDAIELLYMQFWPSRLWQMPALHLLQLPVDNGVGPLSAVAALTVEQEPSALRGKPQASMPERRP